jgi:hypothetical protein
MLPPQRRALRAAAGLATRGISTIAHALLESDAEIMALTAAMQGGGALAEGRGLGRAWAGDEDGNGGGVERQQRKTDRVRKVEAMAKALRDGADAAAALERTDHDRDPSPPAEDAEAGNEPNPANKHELANEPESSSEEEAAPASPSSPEADSSPEQQQKEEGSQEAQERDHGDEQQEQEDQQRDKQNEDPSEEKRREDEPLQGDMDETPPWFTHRPDSSKKLEERPQRGDLLP